MAKSWAGMKPPFGDMMLTGCFGLLSGMGASGLGKGTGKDRGTGTLSRFRPLPALQVLFDVRDTSGVPLGSVGKWKVESGKWKAGQLEGTGDRYLVPVSATASPPSLFDVRDTSGIPLGSVGKWKVESGRRKVGQEVCHCLSYV